MKKQANAKNWIIFVLCYITTILFVI